MNNQHVKFFFDTFGFLVIDNVLNESELNDLNGIIDDKGITSTDIYQRVYDDGTLRGTVPGGGAGEVGAGFLEWGPQFCDLISHPKLLPILRMIIGDGFRLDHFWGTWTNKGASALPIHGGVVPFTQTDYYFARGDRMYSGLTNVAWNLADSGGIHGGFMAMPGSHKSNFEIPKDLVSQEEKAFGIMSPLAPAGSVVIFTEALLHGAAPWVAEFQRRTLFFSFCPSHQAYSRKQAVPPTTVKLTTRQRNLFEPPSAPHSFDRPTLFEPED